MIRVLACLCLLSTAGVARAETTDVADQLTKHALRQIMGAIAKADAVKPGATAAELRHLVRMAYRDRTPDPYVAQLLASMEKAARGSEHERLDLLSKRLYARMVPTVDTEDPYLASVLEEGFRTARLEPGGNRDWLERGTVAPVRILPVEDRRERQSRVYLAALDPGTFDGPVSPEPAAQRRIEPTLPVPAVRRSIVPRIEVDTVAKEPDSRGPDRPKIVSVEKGDTLGGIALRYYGDVIRYRDIASANDLRNPNRLAIGQRLVLP